MILTAKSVLKFGAMVILGSLFLIYILSQSKQYLEGPRLTVSHPENGISTTTRDILVSGKAERISFLALNEMQIFATDEGYFREKLLLSPGYNIIEIKATDRFERERSERLYITYVHQSENEPIDVSSISTTSPPLPEGDVSVSSTSTAEVAEEINSNNN